MTRTKALVRQWTLLRVLSQHPAGLSIEDMARQSNVNVRTIRRDLRFFAEAGIPLRESIGHRQKKAWRIDQRGSKGILTRSRDEVLALAVAIEILRPLAQTQFHKALVKFAGHYQAELTDPLQNDVQHLIHDTGLALECPATKAYGLDASWHALLGMEPPQSASLQIRVANESA